MEFPLYVQHHVVGQREAPRFHPSLRVDGGHGLRNLVQQVVSLEHEVEPALAEAAADLCVPYQVVGVEAAVGIAAAAVHVQVGGQLQLQRQLALQSQPVVVVKAVDGVLGRVLRVDVVPCIVESDKDIFSCAFFWFVAKNHDHNLLLS